MKFDTKLRVEETLSIIEKKIRSSAKKNNVRIAEVFSSFELPNQGYISVETDSPLWVADELSSILSKTKFGMKGVTKTNPGYFDWKSDTYIKPSADLLFIV